MSRRLTLALGLALTFLPVWPVAVAESLPPATQWIPQEAIVVVEVSRPRALLDLALAPETVAVVNLSGRGDKDVGIVEGHRPLE